MLDPDCPDTSDRIRLGKENLGDIEGVGRAGEFQRDDLKMIPFGADACEGLRFFFINPRPRLDVTPPGTEAKYYCSRQESSPLRNLRISQSRSS